MPITAKQQQLESSATASSSKGGSAKASGRSKKLNNDVETTTTTAQKQQVEQVQIEQQQQQQQQAPVEPQPGSFEHNNRILAFELEKYRQLVNTKDKTIIDLNALNFEQREENLRIACTLEEMRAQEQDLVDKYQELFNEYMRLKK